jgi:ABC-type polysaccharide/polyol phosphate export permease
LGNERVSLHRLVEANIVKFPDAALVALHERPRSIWHNALNDLRRLARYRYLGKYLLSASLRFEHVGTTFGYTWWILDPLLTGATYVLLVDVMLHSGGENYPVFVFTSVVVWKSVVVSVRSSMAQTYGRQSLMKQIAFPRSIIPFVAVAAETARFFFGLLVVVGFAAAFGLYPNSSIAFLPLLVLVQLPLILGLALLLSALGMLFRDVDNISDFLFRSWFFLSPAIYAATVVPSGVARSFYDINPFAVLFPAYHAIIVDRATPDLPALGYVAIETLATLIVGYLVFIRLEPRFAKVR